MNQPSIDTTDMLHHLTQAVGNNELSLVFQPKMKKINEIYQLHGVEALMRWYNPQLGHVSPAQFIPLAEKTGLMEHLDVWLIEEVGRNMSHLRNQGIDDLKVSINVSAKQFNNETLVETFINVLNKYQIKPEHVIIEITESVAMHEPIKARQILDKFRSCGFGISIDDFGTGHSSLSYLYKFPVTELKIDKSFTDNINKNEFVSVIIEGIAAMAHKLKMDVVVEGVETLEQMQWIETAIPEKVMIQGYYFSKPLNLDDLILFMNKNST